MDGWVFRLAQPADAEAFAKWASENPQIDPQDLIAGMGKNNPTVLFFVAEKDGVVQTFAPVYLAAMLAHLVFNPAADDKDKLRGLQMLTDGVAGLMVQFGIREVLTLSREEYPVAQWAVKHDFELESRQIFKLDLNKVMARAEEPVNV